MRRRIRLTALVVAAVLVTTGCDGTPATPAASASANPSALAAVLLSPTEQPKGSFVITTEPLRKAAAEVLPGTGEPSGVTVLPRCMSYFAVLGGLDSLEGWYQQGVRPDGAQFIHLVAKVRDPYALDLIRMRISACGKGQMTIKGWPPNQAGNGHQITATMTFKERSAPTLDGALTLAINQTVTFDNPSDPVATAVRNAWTCSARPCETKVAFVQKGDVLIWVYDELADEMAATLYKRSQA